jgi:hypothetical protein
MTLASPAFQASSRFSRASHCSRSNLRAEDLYTCRLCVAWESLPEIRPVRMTDMDHTAVNILPLGNFVRLTVYGPLLDFRCVDLQC